MNKLKCVIYAPIQTYSGYGSRSRDIVKALIDLYKDTWDIKIFPCRWGNTPQGFSDDNPEWKFLEEYSLTTPQLSYQPDIMVWITIPAEFQKVGKVNIGITAGIETTVCDGSWIEGCNRMDLVLVSSEHAKTVFKNTKFNRQNPQTQQLEGKVELSTKMEVLFEGADLSVYKQIPSGDVKNIDLSSVKEQFAFLFCGHYMNGEFGEDRKNVSLLVKAFYETFKNKTNQPALILKTSGGASSYMDRREILKKLDSLRKSVNSNKVPPVYLLHGEFSDGEINELYNHPKVKAMVSLTKGEGFGRPLLEFSMVNKPIIASNWSGHVDFLDPEFSYLVEGELKNVHPSSVVPNMILAESQWFSPNHGAVGNAFRTVFENYKEAAVKGKRQGFKNRKEFSWDAMKDKMKIIFDEIDAKIPRAVALKLPSLKRIELPSLKKIEPQK